MTPCVAPLYTSFQSVAMGEGSAVDRACCCICCRTILAKKDAKVVTEADAEEMEFWYQLEDDYEIISFKAWNAVMAQVQPHPSCGGTAAFLNVRRRRLCSVGA